MTSPKLEWLVEHVLNIALGLCQTNYLTGIDEVIAGIFRYWK